MSNCTTVELKIFLPSKDFALSQRFYREFGFEIEPLDVDLVCVGHGAAKFLLQDYYVKDFADHLLVHFLVEDIDSWWTRAFDIFPNYEAHLGAIAVLPSGARNFVFHDPSGVRWRVVEELRASGIR